ncbi:MAG: hypothetical protein RQ715_11915, partial [Methylococcales bacterium]|nr:hypothetical protein [Methylococcales bacterium]
EQGYNIIVQRYYYGNVTDVSFVCGLYTGDILEFDTVDAAYEYIADEEAGDYVQGNAEYARPTYTVVDSL